MLDALSLANSRARKAVVTTVAAVGTREALTALKRAALQDPDPEVRTICALLISQ